MQAPTRLFRKIAGACWGLGFRAGDSAGAGDGESTGGPMTHGEPGVQLLLGPLQEQEQEQDPADPAVAIGAGTKPQQPVTASSECASPVADSPEDDDEDEYGDRGEDLDLDLDGDGDVADRPPHQAAYSCLDVESRGRVVNTLREAGAACDLDLGVGAADDVYLAPFTRIKIELLTAAAVAADVADAEGRGRPVAGKSIWSGTQAQAVRGLRRAVPKLAPLLEHHRVARVRLTLEEPRFAPLPGPSRGAPCWDYANDMDFSRLIRSMLAAHTV
jgi:hypothetical protein